MPELKIAFLSPSVSRAAGGIFEVERRLAQCLVALPGVSLEAFGTEDEFTRQDVQSWQPVDVRTFRFFGPRSFGWSPGLSRAFALTRADVGHLHVLWMHTSLIMRRWSHRQRKPFVTTLHGMLDPWALANSRWKKRVCALAYERNCLTQAGCVQVFSEAEFASAREFGLKNPVCVIPNGIDLPQMSMAAPLGPAQSRTGRKFCSTWVDFTPKKGLMNLLGAWNMLKSTAHPAPNAWQLVIAGWSQAGHEASLKSLAIDYGIDRNVTFLGPLYGEAKSAAYQHADAVVLPSFSEGLPMAVLEAWSYKKPVLMTAQCNLPEGFAAGAAIESHPDKDSLAEGVAQLTEASDAERTYMGTCGWGLVNRKFTWPGVAAEMHSVYGWLAGGGPKPECVLSE